MTPLTANSGLRALLDAGQNVLLRFAPEGETVQQFAKDVAAGLACDRKCIPSQYLYDARGSELFEQICEQPEYYPTRTEAEILKKHAGTIAAMTGHAPVVELGSGTSIKTQHILRAYSDLQTPVHYVPVDVSASALDEARRVLADEVPDAIVTGIVGPYEAAFQQFANLGSVVVLFLGSTIGNFDEESAEAFWDDIANHTAEGDHFLLGVDLVKESDTLEAAYNDEAGVTADFTCNLFTRMNRELGSEIDVDAVEHVASYNAGSQCVEIDARFLRKQDVHIAPLNQTYTVEAGECIRTEISRKFDLNELIPRLEGKGFCIRETFTDPQDWFALLLMERQPDA